jgi:hypothetical protein
MDSDVFPPKDLDTVFSVLRTALRHSGPLTPRERLFLATYAGITGYSLSKADPIPLIATEVQLSGAHHRKRLIQLAAIAALYNNPVTPGSARFLRELSWQLKTRDSVVGVVHAVEKGRRLWASLLAGLLLRARKDDAISSDILEMLYLHHGILVTRAAPQQARPASVSNEIFGAPLETAA